jgi:hypothetical protein
MSPILVAHLQTLRETIQVYEQSRRIYLSPGERARRIRETRAVIAEIERLAALDAAPTHERP